MLLTFNFSSCIDKSFDDIQPRLDTTSMTANTTIAELKSVYPGTLVKLTDTTFYNRDSILIEGIVISDDKDGNFYKTIVIEDATGGIELKLDKTTLYNDYRRGQRVIIYCNELYLGDYGGLIQLGSTYTENEYQQIGGIEGDVMINKHVFRNGGTLVSKTPITFEASTLTPANLSMLIKIDNAEFQKVTLLGDTKRLTFADKVGGESIDHYLEVCGIPTTNLVLRSSGFAKFANDTIPSLKGSVTGILSYYNGTYQLMIRDLKDINFVNPRCTPL